MKALIERRVTAYDFLRGSSSYKQRLSTRENELSGLEIWRPTSRATVHRLARVVARIARNGAGCRRRFIVKGIRRSLL
jgi:CelD/BcsL family acetyltransferase involved in cellulose biosynthesis